MKPPPFTYYAPSSVEQALSLLQQYGDEAKVLAGGQSLMPLLNMRLARPVCLIDINRIRSLNYIQSDQSGVVVGATVTGRQLERNTTIAEEIPFLVDLAKWVGHPQIRSRGTVCGSIAHADPAAEFPAAAVALDARISVIGPEGSREIAANEFYLGYLDTALGEDELLTEVRFPIPAPGTGWSVQEVARRHGDFALVGALALLRVEDNALASATIVSFGTGGRPLRFPEVESMLVGMAPEAAIFDKVSEAIADLVEPDDDIHASAEYRRQVAGILVRRALEESIARAQGDK